MSRTCSTDFIKDRKSSLWDFQPFLLQGVVIGHMHTNPPQIQTILETHQKANQTKNPQINNRENANHPLKPQSPNIFRKEVHIRNRAQDKIST